MRGFDIVLTKKLPVRRSLSAVWAVLAAAATPVSASVSNWTGTGASANPGWSNGNNWLPTTPPANDGSADIAYTASPATTSVVDTSYAIHSLSFGLSTPAFSIDASGSSTLTVGSGGITDSSAAVETVTAPVNLSAAQTWTTSNLIGDLAVSGAVGGTGPLTIAGPGTVTLTGANTYTGGTDLSSGTLAISGDAGADAALGDPSGGVTFNGGTLRLFGPPAGITSRDFTVNAGGGTFRIDSDFLLSGTLNGAGTLAKTGDATLSVLGDNGPTFSGAVDLQRGGTALYTFGDQPLGTGNVTLRGGSNLSVLAQISGSTASPFTTSTQLASGGTFTYGAGGGLLAPMTASTDGGSILAVTLGGSTNGASANLARTNRGTLIIAPTNGTAATNLGVFEQVFVAGTAANLPAVTNGIVLPTIVGQDSDGNSTGDFLTYNATAGFVSAAGSYTAGFTGSATQVANITAPATVAANTTAYAARINNTSVVISPSVTLSIGDGISGHAGGIIFNGVGSSVSGGTLAFGAAEGVIYTAQGAVIASTVTGSGGLTAFGPGSLTISGPATYTGPTTINGLLEPGGTPSGSVVLGATATISGGGAIAINQYATFNVAGLITGSGLATVDGTLTGNGNIAGPVTVDAGGVIIPGNGLVPTALATGSLSLVTDATATFALNSTAADSIRVTGAVSLGGATLDVEPAPGTNALVGATYVLINNDGSDAVTGTFLNLPQGATFVTPDGERFAVSYTGDATTGTFAGTGNDVLLQAQSIAVPEPTIAAAMVLMAGTLRARRRRSRPVSA